MAKILAAGSDPRSGTNECGRTRLSWTTLAATFILFPFHTAMDERTFQTLELDALLALLARHVQTPLGRRQALALRPSTDRAAIGQALDLVSECAAYLDESGGFGLSGIDDPDAALAALGVAGTSLEPLAIVRLERLIAVSVGLRAPFRDPERAERYPRISALVKRAPDLTRLLATVAGKILPSGEIDEGASPELRRIRKEIVARRAALYRTLESILGEEERAIQEEFITVRNGRFVIPVRSGARGSVPGVVHGLSSSGQTTYVEPLTAIEPNNELVRRREEEEIEIARILLELSNALRASLPGIRAAAETIAELDFVQAKARLAAEFSCVRPRLSPNGSRRFALVEARHILLEAMLRSTDRAIVPISFELDDLHPTMVCSGPNAGGKTVVVKTAGLAALMVQMGLHVPAREAELPVFRQISADIGDQQSIAANLSTFTAHVRNIAAMAAALELPALVLIDEVGTGTDPDEGAALAVAIVDWFLRAGATSIATTHYNPLKIWASETPGVVNASVEFDERTLQPTYRLRVGLAGASAGLEIARRMGLPPGILDDARARLDPDHARANEYLRSLRTLVDEARREREALEAERREEAQRAARLKADFARLQEKRRTEAERALARVTSEVAAEAERWLAGLRDRTEAARARKAVARGTAELHRRAAETLRRESGPSEDRSASSPAGPPLEVRQGDRVRVRSIGREGVVEAAGRDTVTVAIGAVRFRARSDDLEPIGPPAKAPAPPRALPEVDVDRETPAEIQVIGLRADEAESRVDKFLDEAYLAGSETVRIVHGHGKGILRRTIAGLLTGHPHVESFHTAPHDQGGGGATIAVLRKE